jgi:hypothetical protein
MFSSFFSKKVEIPQENLSIYRNVNDPKLTPAQRKAGAKTCIEACQKKQIPAGIYPAERNKNVFNAALAHNDLETFTYLAETLSLQAALNPTPAKKSWLTLAFDAKKYNFIEVFFEKTAVATEADVKALTQDGITLLLNTLEAALHHPRLYHLVDLLLEKAIMPIFQHGVQEPLNQHLNSTLQTTYEKIFDALAFQAGNPPTKSTQLFGLLIKHGIITACFSGDYSPKELTKTNIHFKSANINQTIKVQKLDKKRYYLSLLYLLFSHPYDKDHHVLLHCHHYFHLKQEYMVSSEHKKEFTEKLNRFIHILTLIKDSASPADAVKEYIENYCTQNPGHSDFRDTIFPLASMSDDALRSEHEAYLTYVTHKYTQYVHAKDDNNDPIHDNIALTHQVILKALYTDRDNPLITIRRYLYLNNNTVKHFKEKETLFNEILTKINEMNETKPRHLKDFLKEKQYTSKTQIAAPQTHGSVLSPSLAHFVMPHTGKFARMVCALKQWDSEALKIKAKQYNYALQHIQSQRPGH